MSRFQEYRVAVTTTGEAGSATGSANSETINGEIHAVHIDYNASAPDTTTVDIDEVGGAARKILDKAASKTDVTHYPRVAVEDNTGTGVTYDGSNEIYEPFALAGRKLQVAVAASDELTDAVVVTIIVKEE